MTTQMNSTLPERQPKRASMFSIRLTQAKRLKLPDSYMARHFILEAVHYHKNHLTQEAAIEA